MDIWVAPNPENAARVSEALVEFGFGAQDVPPRLFEQPGRIARMGVPPLRIEVLTGVSGVEFEACHSRRVCGSLDGVPVSVIALADLRANKKAAGRHKDLDDLEHLG
mgnify:CR=1 FL=1